MRRGRVFRVTLFSRRRVLANKRVFARSLHSFGNNVAVAVLPPPLPIQHQRMVFHVFITGDFRDRSEAGRSNIRWFSSGERRRFVSAELQQQTGH